MASKNSITDPAAPPFATRDGRPIAPTAGPTGARDFTRTENRAQSTRPLETEGPETPPLGLQRAQEVPRDPAERVSMRDAGRGGPGMVDGAATVARGGVQGTAHNPMKFGSAPSAKPASASRASSASGASSGDKRNTTEGFPGRAPSSSSKGR